MSKYEVNTILSMWGQDKLTVEQAVGQILQHLQALLGRVGQLEKQVEQWRRQEERETAVSGTTKPIIVPEPIVEPQTEETDRHEVAPPLPEPSQQALADEVEEAEETKALADAGLKSEMGGSEEGDQSQLTG